MKRRMFRILGLFAALALVTACDDGGDGDGAGGAGGIVGGEGGAGGAGATGEGGSGEGGAGEGGSGEGGAGEGGAGGVQAAVQSLTITPLEEPLAGSEHRYEVVATFEDGTTGPAEGITWGSSNEDIVTFADGTATFPYGGSATITASVGDVEATLDVTVGCDYPRFPANIVFNKPLAPVTWDSVLDHEGNEFSLSLRDISCSAEYKQFSAFFVIVNAEWCPPCQQEIRELAPVAEELEALGGKLIFITLQNQEGGPIDHRGASRFISRYGDDIPSIRAGVIGSNPEQFFNNPAIIQAFPSSFVVRKRDMTVIADSRGLQYHLHPLFANILQDLEADWSDPRANIPFEGNCGEAEEEPSEPNDTVEQAAELNVGDAFSGGICAAEPDFYRINAEGAWQLDVEFTHAVGDIDIAFVGPDGRPLADRPGANSSTDNETIQGEGPATVVVYGYAGASAPYTLSLTARGE